LVNTKPNETRTPVKQVLGYDVEIYVFGSAIKGRLAVDKTFW
jgi:predicted nucleotidyltransferase